MQINALSIYNASVHRKEQLAIKINTIHAVNNLDFIHVYFCEATDSPNERIAGSFISSL